MRPLCIVQARMGSTRLPGKVMMEINGKPLIGYLIERLMKFDPIVAGLLHERETTLAHYVIDRCQSSWARPDADDVAGRFAHVLQMAGGSDAFIRICADSPLLDPALVDAAVTLYQPPYFMIHSPVGCAEVCDTTTFLADLPDMNAEQREHVTLTLKARARHPFVYIGGNRRLVVDSREDFDRVASVIEKMDRPHTEYGWRECLALL